MGVRSYVGKLPIYSGASSSASDLVRNCGNLKIVIRKSHADDFHRLSHQACVLLRTIHGGLRCVPTKTFRARIRRAYKKKRMDGMKSQLSI